MSPSIYSKIAKLIKKFNKDFFSVSVVGKRKKNHGKKPIIEKGKSWHQKNNSLRNLINISM